MILSVKIEPSMNAKLAQDSRRTGLTKSVIVRHILATHYANAKQIKMQTVK